ncbi:hypothetical protein NQ318_000781, partial [Aromia moschata]
MEEDESLLAQKKKHPWLLPYFVKGYKRQLTENDLCGVMKSHDSVRLGDKLEAAWDDQVARKKNPSLLIALIKVFYVELSLYGILYLIQEFIVKLSQPVLITRFLRFYEPNQTDMHIEDAYMYAGLIVLFAFANVMCIHHYYFCVMHLGLKIRVATCSLIYRKALKLNKSAFASTTVGQIVNLLSNDVGRFDYAVTYIHNLWVAPIETAVIMYFLYDYVGPTGLTGVSFLILFILPQIHRAETICDDESRPEELQQIKEALTKNGYKEKDIDRCICGKKISDYRSRTAKCTDERVRLMGEIINGIQVIKLYAWETAFAKMIEKSRKMEMKQIWATSIIRAIMNTCISVLHRSAIYLCIIVYVLTGSVITATYAYTIASFYSILRQVITMFLPRAVTQFAETRISLKRIEKFLCNEEQILSRANNNSIFASNQQKQPLKTVIDKGVHLENVSVKWSNSAEYVLENINFHADSAKLVAIVGRVGGGKTALLYTILKELATVEGSVEVEGSVSYASQEPWLFDGNIRQNILCETDFNSLPYGDKTLMGDLSGGQRSRVSLARTIYKDADIYLLDDPLSSVDTRVGNHIFEQCIRGYLKKKCVVLVTNQLQYLKNVDTIYLIRNGNVQAEGSYDELRKIGDEFTDLLIESNDEDNEEADTQLLDNTKDVMEERKDGDKPIQEREQRSTGKISKAVYKSYIQAGGSWCLAIMVLLSFFVAQVLAVLADYFIILWVNLEQWRSQHMIRRNSIFSISYDTLKGARNYSLDNTVKHSIYNTLNPIITENVSLLIYSLLIISSVILAFTRSLYFFKYCVRASTKLHNVMFKRIIKAPMKFFNTNPAGRILNRFSKDIGSVDEMLPQIIADTLQIALILLSTSVVVGILYPWILLLTVLIVIIFYYIRLVFFSYQHGLKTNRGCNPIYTHLRSSVQGLTTIRALGVQDMLKRRFDDYQNQYTASCFLSLGANRSFGFWLDFHCVVYTAFIVISILVIKSEIFAGNVGFALTEAVALTGTFQWGIRQWSEMENQMTSVERIQEYIDITSEKDGKTRKLSKSWPEVGHLKFNQLCLRYVSHNVLDNLTFEVKAKEKIGIVGRTGAGKSSIITAIFRLADTDGQILIDNVDIKEIPLNTLRSKISIIPQEPILFSGTIRMNLDPFGKYTDDMIWTALEHVELKKNNKRSPFRVGQRQLLCLARAIIHKNKILVMDEATANVDQYTDELIQKAVRKNFKDCTVLTIAHRIHTIIDSDKVLVMDDGRVAEYDHPYKLLQNEGGLFSELVSQTGRATAKFL